MRWAAADELIVSKWPKGALFVGSNLENHPVYGDKLIYDQASGIIFPDRQARGSVALYYTYESCRV